MRRRWTNNEREILRAHYREMPFSEMKMLLPGRTEYAISEEAKRMEIRIRRRPWTTAEIEFVRANRRTMHATEIAEKLDRSVAAVQIQASRIRAYVWGPVKTPKRRTKKQNPPAVKKKPAPTKAKTPLQKLREHQEKMGW